MCPKAGQSFSETKLGHSTYRLIKLQYCANFRKGLSSPLWSFSSKLYKRHYNSRAATIWSESLFPSESAHDKNAPLTSSIFWVSLCNCLLAHKKLIIGVAVDGASDWFGNFSDNEYNFVLQKKKLGEMIPFRMGKMSVFQNMLYCFSHGTWHQYFIRNVTFSNQESFFWKKNSMWISISKFPVEKLILVSK